MLGLDSLLHAVPVVVGCFFLHRDCFVSGVGLGTIGPARWDSQGGTGGALLFLAYLFSHPPLFSRARDFFFFF